MELKYNKHQLTEIRKQIFPIYNHLNVCITNTFKHPESPSSSLNYCEVWGVDLNLYRLLLKPISCIQKQEAKDIFNIFRKNNANNVITISDKIIVEDEKNIQLFIYPDSSGFYFEDKNNANLSICKGDIETLSAYRYLQLKGFATDNLVIIDNKPVIISVDEQVNLGVIELIK